MKVCPICGQSGFLGRNLGETNEGRCERCGRYQVVNGRAIALVWESEYTDRQRANMSSYLFENPGFVISQENFESLLSIKTPSFHSRADKLLLNLEKETNYIGKYLNGNPSWLASSWSLNDGELEEIIQFLQLSGRIFRPDTKREYKITPQGWEHLEKLKEVNPQSDQCFVAMWFDDNMKKIYDEVFVKAITDAGYGPHRVDQREYNDKIDDEIIVQIRRSRFIVADFTGHRGGVYYEGGFAKGLGLEVIWTCRKDYIDNLHFDIRQYNFIVWENDHLPEFTQRLAKRIESVFGHGSYST